MCEANGSRAFNRLYLVVSDAEAVLHIGQLCVWSFSQPHAHPCADWLARTALSNSSSLSPLTVQRPGHALCGSTAASLDRLFTASAMEGERASDARVERSSFNAGRWRDETTSKKESTMIAG